HVAGQTPSHQQLQEALSEQDQWLANQPTAAGWDKYLRTGELKQQLAAGPAANPAVVQSILDRYQASEPGLRLPQFVSTAETLAAWAVSLAQPSAADLPAMARAAKANFKPVAKADVLAREVAADAGVRRLDRYLKNSGSNGADWARYLKLADLQSELKKDL